MRELICDVIICCVWSCDTGEINVNGEVVIENQKKRKIWKSKNFLRKSPSNRWFRNHSLLRQDDARETSFTVRDAYRYCVGQA